MKNDPEHSFFGTKLKQWMKSVAKEIEYDQMSFCPIVQTGRLEFSLEGSELVDYLREYIIRLIEKGATPIRPDKMLGWVIQAQYGRTPIEIAENIIQDWERNPHVAEDFDWLWFKILTDEEKNTFAVKH